MSGNMYAPVEVEKTINNPKIECSNPGTGSQRERERITTKPKN